MSKTDRHIEIPLTLKKAASSTGEWTVGGVASSFHRDLDGEAIVPSAVERAIAGFMAARGVDGIHGGPIKLHHDFYEQLLRQAIDLLHLPVEQQIELIAAIALPLGRVTKMWVDGQGVTHWRGFLSQANPIAKIIWQLLKEGLIHLGVSLGGKILATQMGRDTLGRVCTLISEIRLDELSITDNPALRLVEGEGTGAYITALVKSIRSTLRSQIEISTDMDKLDRWLKKALSVPETETKTGMGRRSLGEPKSVRPRGGKNVSMDGSATRTGMGGKSAPMVAPKATGNEPKTDVWGMTVEQFTRSLAKCSCMNKAQWSDRELLKSLTDGAYGLTTVTDRPPDELVNFVRFLQYLTRFAQELPYMDNYQAEGTVAAMNRDLSKSLEEFLEKMPDELMKRTFRPPGVAGISGMDIVFPQQYVVYS